MIFHETEPKQRRTEGSVSRKRRDGQGEAIRRLGLQCPEERSHFPNELISRFFTAAFLSRYL